MTNAAEILDDLPLEAVQRLAFEALIADVHVAMPGEVQVYDSLTRLASVRPLLMRRYRGDALPTQAPVIHDVPVVHPRTTAAEIIFPVAKGDLCLLIFADRAVKNWIAGAGETREPKHTRTHHLSDGFAILGGYPVGKAKTPKYPGALEINVLPGTKVAVTNGAVELLDLIDQVIAKINTTLTNIQAITVSGNLGYPTSVPINASSFATTATELAAIATLLGQLKP